MNGQMTLESMNLDRRGQEDQDEIDPFMMGKPKPQYDLSL